MKRLLVSCVIIAGVLLFKVTDAKAQDCGNITYEGCCEGSVVKFCMEGQLYEEDCGSQSTECGWNDMESAYWCMDSASSGPSQFPRSCTGGSSGYCGDGSCGAGENSSTCPSDCSGGNNPVCGNGSCESGENATSCPNDCGGTGNCSCAGRECGFPAVGCGSCGDCTGGPSFYCDYTGKCKDKNNGCVPACTGKACGSDGCGGTCATCPGGYSCNAEFQCEPEACTASCVGKTCGSDGCGGTCGSCQIGFVCNHSFQCVDQATCTPDCANRECGSDGCGGLCGSGNTCGPGLKCTDEGACVASGGNEEVCEDGYTYMYGKCVLTGKEGGGSSGCSFGGMKKSCGASKAFLLLAALFGLAALRRRTHEKTEIAVSETH